jgi:deoxycytidylate deaminase
MTTPPVLVVERAIMEAAQSPCQSKRGAAIFKPEDGGALVSVGYNHQVEPFVCDGSDKCKSHCRQTAIHAEQSALVSAGTHVYGLEMLHVKVVDGRLVPSGVPSCVACSKLIVSSGLQAMWLYQHDGWRRYGAEDFHLRSVAASMVNMR